MTDYVMAMVEGGGVEIPLRWLHIVAGIIWMGHNYVNVVLRPRYQPLTPQDLETRSPRFMTLLYREHAVFRYASMVTWLAGAGILWRRGWLSGAFTLTGDHAVIGMGAWIGTLMMLNVWLVLWPHQRKVLGFVPASPEERIRCARITFLAARTNTMLSIPLLFFMATAASAHVHPADEAARPHAGTGMASEAHTHAGAALHTHEAEGTKAGHVQGEVAPERGGTTPAPRFVRTLLFLTLAIAAALALSARRTLRHQHGTNVAPGVNLLEKSIVGTLLHWRYFAALLIAPTLFVFVFIVLAGLFGEQNTSNPAIPLTWILWWPAVIFTFVLMGRIWCVACPFGWLGDVAQKIVSLRLKVPRIFKNMWWRLGLFLGLTWATTLWALDRSPWGTAWLGLGLTGAAMAMGMIFEKRSFCRYVCPVGGIFGLYSMTAPVRLGVKDRQMCQRQCAGKNCFQACRWFQFPAVVNRNAECNLCLDCVRACPYNNFIVETQPFGTDLTKFQPRRKSLDEATTVAAVLGMSLLQTAVMLHGWEGWEVRIGSFLHIPPGPALYTILFLGFGVLLPTILVALVSYWSSHTGEFRADVSRAFRTYAYAFLPLGLALHAAHNFRHLFGEGGVMWSEARNTLARYTGWAILASPETTRVAPSIGPNAVFLLQWLALIGGLYLAFRVGAAVASRAAGSSGKAFRAAWPVLLFAVAYTVMNVLILSAPMAHRHG